MNIKRKLLAAMGTMALAALLISAGTFALFTDGLSNKKNTFAAGTLSIEDITNGDGSAAIKIDHLAPGDHTGQVSKDSDKFVIQTHPACGTPNPPWWCEDHDDNGDDDHGNGGESGEGTHDPGEMTIVNNGSLDAWVKLSDFVTEGYLLAEEGDFPLEINIDDTPVLLQPEEQISFQVEWAFPLQADNSYQGAEGTVHFIFEAVQADNNTNEAGDGPISWNGDGS